ncbi:putative 3-beta hydroxysteroid dehydrogenase/isomerase family protein [Trichoderma citrinoviride]|uniref:Putative 3-beta hydroxysteroid dehydrogenase/isomerase family protein n=1 Tax=Trichoderma citrinoviride TaxID=58853 RepID=A0A2T4B5C0_9HYPO|nr:putative 3-beta hydroxysteroid dehydrogenase/isomerase family protein [Trichoderma citrinoviride]PTB64468.1 putative 3-beta hydroxysteroid dehydrogenase/isomerase family protein [Trichoderma citrinoviride]
MGQALLGLAAGVLCLALYTLRLNWVLSHTPPEAAHHAADPLTKEHIRDVFERVKRDGIDWVGELPPRKDRRYIVVGGSGLLGGQIVLHLLAMGTPPEAIRIVDVRRPFTFEEQFCHEPASKVAVVQTDITDEAATLKSYEVPWPEAVANLPLTVFHTAGVIRPFERYAMFYERTSRVNVTGAMHSLQAAKKVGASIFVYTSSSNAALKQVKWLFAPWARRQQPQGLVQLLDNSDFFEPLRPPTGYPTNYARSKAEAERLVCGADERVAGAGSSSSASRIRTGVIRPGNAVYGHVRDNVVGRMLGLKHCPTWVAGNVQSWCHVQNASLAHLLYEDALLGDHVDRVAGRPYIVTDRGKPLRFDDVYRLLDTASTTGLKVSYPPPVLMLVLCYLVEWYALVVNMVPKVLQRWVSEPGEPLRWVQPGVFATGLNRVVDDSEARRGVEEGGIGYRAGCSTVEGMCEMVRGWNEWIAKGR